jgi:hypothetical protein
MEYHVGREAGLILPGGIQEGFLEEGVFKSSSEGQTGVT